MKITDVGTITRERVMELLHYEPETGLFTWKVNQGARAMAGYVAGTKTQKYKTIKLDGRSYYAHRIAFLVMTGRWPTMLVDHKNGDKHDNSWANLREADFSQNGANTAGLAEIKGVYLTKSGRYCTRIKVKGKTKHIGNFITAQEAMTAYRAAAAAAFGEFGRN